MQDIFYSIIPIYKIGRPLSSPASFRLITQTSCVPKLFERIIPLSLLFFLESYSIPSQASFHPGWSTLNQIHYFCQSILNGFNKLKTGSRVILATIDFSKAFDSVWHFDFCINLFRLASLPALLVDLNLSFLTGALVWFFKITKFSYFGLAEVFHGDPFLVLFFSSFHQRSYCSLRFFVNCSFYTDDLAI